MSLRVRVWFWVAALSLLLSSCYVTKQAIYQNDLMNRREWIDGLLNKSTLDPDLRKSFLQLRRILFFAKASGLNSDGAYEYYIETPQAVVSYLVVAAEPLSLKRKMWSFPFVGDVPYLGFFKKEDRDTEAIKLREQGLDVHETSASAFSSLGWFDDPLYKSMIHKRSEIELAHLIFHELTHRTVWIPNNSSFNEGLAEFVADRLLDRYLEHYRINPEDLKEERRDDALFANWVQALKEELRGIYDSSQSRAEKLERKAKIFLLYTKEKWPPFETTSYDHLRKKTWNNAMLLGISLYTNEKQQAAKLYDEFNRPKLADFLKRVLHERPSDRD